MVWTAISKSHLGVPVCASAIYTQTSCNQESTFAVIFHPEPTTAASGAAATFADASGQQRGSEAEDGCGQPFAERPDRVLRVVFSLVLVTTLDPSKPGMESWCTFCLHG